MISPRNTTDLQPLIQRAIESWRSEDIPISPGVSETKIEEFERRYGIRLPRDMREFYATVNGIGDDYDGELFRFWPLEQLASVPEYCREVAKALPELYEYFIFFDHSIDAFSFAICLGKKENASTPIMRVPPYESISETAIESFTQFLEVYVNDPKQLHLVRRSATENLS